MTSSWLFPAFLVFLLSALFLWALGGAVFGSFHGSSNLFRLPWLGYGVLLGCLQIAHLFFPIDHRFSFIFLMITAGATIAVLITKAVWRSDSPREAQSGWLKLLPLVLLAFCIFVPVFNASTKPACHYDLGLYYLQEIRWIETFPIVRGVGNLILNLGFNQSAFLVTSFLDGLLPDRIGLWLVGGFLPWLGLTLSAYAAVRLMAARKVPPLTAGDRIRRLTAGLDLHAARKQHLEWFSRRHLFVFAHPSFPSVRGVRHDERQFGKSAMLRRFVDPQRHLRVS